MSVYATDHHSSVLRTHSWRTAQNSMPFLLPHIKPSMRVLDVGCGPGTITLDIARLLPNGHITGVEYSATPLASARALAASTSITNATFQQGDVHDLPFPDNHFDIVYAHQVLQHVSDPVKALREMKRVSKSTAGIVAVRETAGMHWYPPSEGIARWRDLYLRVARGKGGNPDPGGEIHAWARRAGWIRGEIQCGAGTWVFSEKADRAWWSGIWTERLTESGFVESAVGGGYCEREELEGLAQAWKEWGKEEDGWFCVLHGDIVCKVE